MENHFLARSNDSENNASFVTMATANQMISPEALYNNNGLAAATGDNQYYSNNNYSNSQYVPHITTTPVVKSHHPTAIATTIPMFTPPSQAAFPLNYQHNPQANYTPIDVATNNIMNMEIDDYFTPTTTLESNQMFVNTMHNVVYSPSSTSVTTNNSSIMMIDTMSPTSPTHNMMMSPEFANQPMDTAFMSPTGYHQPIFNNGLDHHVFPETPIVPTNIGMHPNYSTQNILHYGSNHDIQQPQQYVDRKNRRPLPRRHTVSTPYSTSVNSNPKGKEPINDTMNMNIALDPAMNSQQQQQQQPPVTKSRKSSLKAKRHRSLGKLDIYGSNTTTSPPPVPDMATFDPLSAKLELWTHEQLLERVMELEKEKQEAQSSMIKQQDESAVDRSASAATTASAPTTAANAATAPMSRKASTTTATSSKIRSASHTDTELDEDEDDEEEVLICKWDACSKELNTLDDLINHVKSEHIGSGKANYYCLWKDCARNQKPFTKRHKMHNHLRTHTGERPFMCQEPDCGKKFSRPDSLTTHAKIHSNIRPYICTFNECGKAYYHLRSLRKHERTHTSTTQDSGPKSTSSSPPPPVPPVVMPVATSTVVAHATSSHPADELLVGPDDQQVFSDWGLAAQAAVFNVMEREDTYM